MAGNAVSTGAVILAAGFGFEVTTTVADKSFVVGRPCGAGGDDLVGRGLTGAPVKVW